MGKKREKDTEEGREGIRQTGTEGDERERKTARETGNESEMKRDNKEGGRQGGKLRVRQIGKDEGETGREGEQE